MTPRIRARQGRHSMSKGAVRMAASRLPCRSGGCARRGSRSLSAAAWRRARGRCPRDRRRRCDGGFMSSLMRFPGSVFRSARNRRAACAANSCVALPGSPPRPTRRFWTSGSLIASSFRVGLSTIAFGVPAGDEEAVPRRHSTPGKPASASVGTSGSSGVASRTSRRAPSPCRP